MNKRIFILGLAIFPTLISNNAIALTYSSTAKVEIVEKFGGLSPTFSRNLYSVNIAENNAQISSFEGGLSGGTQSTTYTEVSSNESGRAYKTIIVQYE